MSRTIYKRVIVTPGTLEKIRSEAKRFRCRETGGALVGYVDSEDSVVIVDASGPGPRALHRPMSVTIDGEAATEFCDQWSKKTRARIRYIGDWHSHVSAFCSPSPTDLKAMLLMSKFTPPLSPPISFIIARISRRYAVYALNHSSLSRLKTECCPDEHIAGLIGLACASQPRTC